jgi:hypothetical protein
MTASQRREAVCSSYMNLVPRQNSGSDVLAFIGNQMADVSGSGGLSFTIQRVKKYNDGLCDSYNNLR